MRNAIATALLALSAIGCHTDEAVGPDDAAFDRSAAEPTLAGFATVDPASAATSCPRATAAAGDAVAAGKATQLAVSAPRAGTWGNGVHAPQDGQPAARAGALANSGRTHVHASGAGIITDPDDNSFPVRLAITAAVGDAGAASGHINFHFSRPFGQAWGALPVDRIHLDGRVTSGEVLANETVVLEGTLTEREYVNGEGVVFIEENVPFRIAAGGALGAGSMTFTWCLLPEFQIQLTDGKLRVQ